ncbi:hypothetical protein AAVH_06831 [Aphelenchoides avenae]|nr:hypothetical protein AAVH_06831 [Aphelenchus avenae]
MPSNEDPKNRAAGGKNNVNPIVVGFGPPGTETDGTPAAAPGNEGNAPVPPNSVSSSADGTPMEVDPNASVKDKVSHWAKEVEKLCYSYGDQLMQVTQEKLDSVRLGNPQLFKDTISSWGPVRKKVQPALNQYLVKLVEAVPDDVEPEPALVGHKQAAYTQIYDTVLGKMSRDICERMAESGSAHIDFGRDSDYGQAMEAQQALAKDRDDLQLQLEGFQQQVADLKASEAYLQRQCTEMQEKFSGAQTDLLAYTDKVGILEAVTTFLGTTENDVVGVLAHIQLKYRNLEQQDDSARIADLESQLQSAKTANVHLQRTVAEYEKQLVSSSGGSKQSLVERAREIGFFVDASGNLQLGPSPSKVFDVSRPYCYTNRTQSVPVPPPLKVFLGDYKEDKMGLSEFLRMYKRRITYDELEFRMKNLMLDNSRTGTLLKQQRVHSLRMKEDESYLSFITYLETKVCEAYDHSSFEIIDGVKIQVLLKNLRDPTLALQVEQALRTVPLGSPLFPVAKDLVIAYERTAKQALQWSAAACSAQALLEALMAVCLRI